MPFILGLSYNLSWLSWVSRFCGRISQVKCPHHISRIDDIHMSSVGMLTFIIWLSQCLTDFSTIFNFSCSNLWKQISESSLSLTLGRRKLNSTSGRGEEESFTHCSVTFYWSRVSKVDIISKLNWQMGDWTNSIHIHIFQKYKDLHQLS